MHPSNLIRALLQGRSGPRAGGVSGAEAVVRRGVLCAGVLMLATGCTSDDEAAARTDSIVAAPAVGSRPAVGTPPGAVDRAGARPGAVRVLGAAGSDCELVGMWRACSVEDRFVRAGLAPQRVDTAPEVPAEAAEAWRYWLGDAEVQVYLFADERARAEAERTLGDAIGEPPLLEAARGAQRAHVSSGNLLAVVYGPRPRQVERITLTLSAALPAG